MTPTPHAILNGALVDRADARVGADDLGLLVGDGVFETVAVQNGVAVFLDAHLERLARSLDVLRFDGPPDMNTLRAQVDRLLAVDAAATGRARLRITVTRGPGAPPATPRGAPTVLVTLDTWSAPADLGAGVAVEVAQHARAPHPLHQIKSTSYAHSAWLRREATDAATFEVLACNTHGQLAEGSFTNVFVVDAAGVLRTPAPADGCLPGITRGVVLELARAAGLPCQVGAVAAATLETAREAFLTASLVGLVPVRSVGHMELGACPGPVTAALRAAYADRVRQVVAAAVPERGAHSA